ncbi:uncharacterized protein LOC131691259 [Topomyia yanbarensis]|uniref:uncharacterized protein LOC131691259 n=1 Tax=Topomyia yanbarensis TaxID=2498891 RepID=UPI00273AE785|nr:uncharacterized protein LOC131691259 [Topomyia yanbarensis]
MASVTMEALVLLLFVLLVNSCHSITTSNDKIVTSSGNERDTQSVTFASNGEDQLIFRDSAFQVQNGASKSIHNPIRRADHENGATEFFESGWMPLHSIRFGGGGEGGEREISDQLSQENVIQPTVLVDPSKRTTKFLRFSESDIMHVPMDDPVMSISENVIKFNDASSEEEYEEYSSSLQDSEEREIPPLAINLTSVLPRMLKFEESDRMKFKTEMPSVLKFADESRKSKMPQEGSQNSANYEVYVIENLMRNMTGSLRFENMDMQSGAAANYNPTIQKEQSNVPRNSSSRFFRFEDQERPRRDMHPGAIKFQDNMPQKEEFKFPNSDVSRTGEMHYYPSNPIKFHETDSRPQAPSPSQMRFEESGSEPFKFADNTPANPQMDSDQFYTVKATIQIGSWDSATAITPPSIPVTTRRPKKKRPKIYNQHLLDIRKQDGFNYQQPSDYDNYLQIAQQPQSPLNHYPSNPQIPPTPESIPSNPYYQNQGTPYPPFNPNNYYIQDYLSNYPYPAVSPNQQQAAEGSSLYPSLYPQQPYVPTNLISGGQTDSPISAQSIFGFLQSIFNFAPGTFGNYQSVGQASNNAAAGAPQSSAEPNSSPIMAVSTQLRKALDNIAGNDELQCVPKLICMMSRRSSGQGFSTYVNRGLLSTVLSAVPDSSPWLKFSRAALLGYGIGANSCDVYYPKCPKDESEIIYYLNNHRGGFFRFFNDEHSNGNKG